MEAGKKRNIRSGQEYDHLFPKADAGTQTIMRNAGVGDTVAFIPKVVQQTLSQTAGIAQALKRESTYDTCSAIWHFVYSHIAYRKDRDGYEQIRSPSRAWHDRRYGVDCDCYSTFISSILTNLGIPHLLRITKYHRDYFQHIYPVVKSGNREIIIDCVTDRFDYEVPYSEKQDYTMDLQYLNGIEGIYSDESLLGETGGGIAELGRLVKKQLAQKKAGKAAAKSTGSNGDQVAPSGASKKKKGILKKVLNVTNKVNPATVLLRNGILASMKLNLGKAAGRLRWSYLSPNAARAKGIDMNRFPQLVALRQKLENIFYGAGGNPDNLKKAILGSKGNKDKAVSGLFGYDDISGYATIHTPLSQLLGPDIWQSENVSGMEGLGQLGEPVTAATITAASGVMLAIIGAIKKIGDIFGGKGKGSEDFSEAATASAESEIPGAAATSSGGSSNSESSESIPTVTSTGSGNSPAVITTSARSQSSGNSNYASGGESDGGSSANLPAAITPTTAAIARSSGSTDDGTTSSAITPSAASNSNSGEGFWTKNKSWLLPVSIGIGGITLLAISMKAMKPAPAAPQGKAMHGTPKNYRRKAKPKPKKKQGKKAAVALL